MTSDPQKPQKPLTKPERHALDVLKAGGSIHSSVSKATMGTPRLMHADGRMTDVSWTTLQALVDRGLLQPKKLPGERLLRWSLDPKVELPTE